MPKDIGNANWWGRRVSIGDWTLEVRVRRKDRRSHYRRLMKVDAFNYGHDPPDEHGPMPMEPTTRGRCYNCGQDWKGDTDA
jgi:hypothetical protein